MPNKIRDLHEIFEDKENNLIFEKNVSIPIKNTDLPVRANVYRPIDSKEGKEYPVLATYGPYGKDIWYGDFHAKSWSEVPPEHKSKYSAWETPDPVFWTNRGYIVLRADERGLGQSPGLMDTMSQGTSECFFDVIEWAAQQSWSSGKVGLLGISYYAGSQWRVAARQPKGLAAIIPWEGMSDYYRDRCRHGGIFSNNFINFWWNRQVVTNQYGRPGRAASKWGEDTTEGDLPSDELLENCNDQNIDNEANQFRNDPYYSSKDFKLEDIKVPLLSVANWGGILLHLRGNVEGYTWAGSKNKWIRFIVGRHDLPFYYPEEVAIQESFMEAFLKGKDKDGWKSGKVAPVDLVLRKGDVGFNNAAAEKQFPRRQELEWPIARTTYTKFFLTPKGELDPTCGFEKGTLSYQTLGSIDNPQLVSFFTKPFEVETEITGHIVAKLNVSVASAHLPPPANLDIDIFLTLRHISPAGKEVFYTGSSGDNVPLTKGWLRASLRKLNTSSPKHRPWLPHREYLSTDVQQVENNVVYDLVIELWPTNVIVESGGRLVFEVASGDTQGCGLFRHTNLKDRPESKLAGTNHLHFGPELENYLTLPIIPEK